MPEEAYGLVYLKPWRGTISAGLRYKYHVGAIAGELTDCPLAGKAVPVLFGVPQSLTPEGNLSVELVTDGADPRRAAAVAAMFAALTAQVVASGWLTGGDGPTLDWLIAHRSATWTSIATPITNLGSPAGTAAIGVAVAALLAWRTRRIAPAAAVLGTLAIAGGANTVTKYLVGRERPPALTRLVDPANLSYPSGHVVGTTALAGAVLLVCLASRPSPVRAAIAAAAAVLAVAVVALTRLYLGVHWLSDTLGGALLGTTVVLAVAAVVASTPALDISPRARRSHDSEALFPAG